MTTGKIFSTIILRGDILREARSLGIHLGFAEVISEKVASSVDRYLESHSVYTDADIERLVVRELKKYNSDLAYIYHNRDKII